MRLRPFLSRLIRVRTITADPLTALPKEDTCLRGMVLRKDGIRMRSRGSVWGDTTAAFKLG